MTFWVYFAGWIAATGYQLVDDEPRLYDLIVCPLFWPAVLAVQIMLVTLRLDRKRGVQ